MQFKYNKTVLNLQYSNAAGSQNNQVTAYKKIPEIE